MPDDTAASQTTRRAGLAKRVFDRAWKATLIGLCVGLLSLIFSHMGITFLSSRINALQDAGSDQIVRLLFDHPLLSLPSPPLPDQFPDVWLIGLDKPFMSQLKRDEKNGTATPRGRLADLLWKLDELEPRALFIDIDLSDTANERGLSEGDMKIQDFLAEERDYPVLVPNRELFGEALNGQYPRVCPTHSELLLNRDERVRRLNLAPSGEGVYSATYYLKVIGNAWEGRVWDCEDLAQAATRKLKEAGLPSGVMSRIVFRPWAWVDIPGADRLGNSYWQRGHYLSAQGVVEGFTFGANVRDDIFIVGSTDPSVPLADRHLTPVGALGGAEIHFHALMTLAHYERASWKYYLLRYGAVYGLTLVGFFLAYLPAEILKRRFRRPILKNVLELLVVWLVMTLPALLLLHYLGVFVDFVVPSLGLKLWGTFGASEG